MYYFYLMTFIVSQNMRWQQLHRGRLERVSPNHVAKSVEATLGVVQANSTNFSSSVSYKLHMFTKRD
jgi:hypothetical protein